MVWEIALDKDQVIGDVFRRTINEKDRLAGYDTLLRNRHFLSRSELLRKLQEAGGVAPTVVRTVQYRFRSMLRLHAELDGNETSLVTLNAYIRQEYSRLPEAKRTRFQFEDKGDSVEFDVPVVIASIVKPAQLTKSSLAVLEDRTVTAFRMTDAARWMRSNEPESASRSPRYSKM